MDKPSNIQPGTNKKKLSSKRKTTNKGKKKTKKWWYYPRNTNPQKNPETNPQINPETNPQTNPETNKKTIRNELNKPDEPSGSALVSNVFPEKIKKTHIRGHRRGRTNRSRKSEKINTSVAEAPKNTENTKLDMVVNYMITNFGNESRCLMIPYYAFHYILDKPFINYEENIHQFNLPVGEGIVIIAIQILSMDENWYLAGYQTGNPIHEFLIIYDSNTSEYQILSAANDSYTLNEYYNGVVNNCDTCNLENFDNTKDLMERRKTIPKTDMHNKEIEQFKKYYEDKDGKFPRHGFDLNKIIKVLKSLSSNKTTREVKLIKIKDADTVKQLNLVVGYDFINEYGNDSYFGSGNYDKNSILCVLYKMQNIMNADFFKKGMNS